MKIFFLSFFASLSFICCAQVRVSNVFFAKAVPVNPPGFTIASTSNVSAPFTATMTAGQGVTGFIISDITVTNASLSSFVAVSTTVYTVTVTPTSASVTLFIAAGVCNSIATGDPNAASDIWPVSYNSTVPLPVFSGPTETPGNYTATITFNIGVINFVVGNITTTNGTLSSFTKINSSLYTVLVTPTVAGNVTLDIASSVCTSNYGANNTAATSFVTNYTQETSTPLLKWRASTNVVSSSGLVSSWTDEMLGVAAVQATTANKPTILTNAYNGNAAISFDGAKTYLQYLGTVSGLETASGVTFIMVATGKVPGSFGNFVYDGGAWSYGIQGNGANQSIRFENNSKGIVGGIQLIMFNQTTATASGAKSVGCLGSQIQVATIVYDGTKSTGNARVAYTMNAGGKPTNQGTSTYPTTTFTDVNPDQRQLLIGGIVLNTIAYMGGSFFEIRVYNSALSDNEIKNITINLANAYGFRHKRVVICDGDSRTCGSATIGSSYPNELQKLNSNLLVYNVGLSGEQMVTLAANVGSRVSTQGTAIVGDGTKICVQYAGRNDMAFASATPATIYAAITTWISSVHAAGMISIVCSETPSFNINETDRLNLNILIRGNAAGADYILDLGADTTIGLTGQNVPPYYNADGIHESPLGEQYVAGLLNTLILTIP